MLGALATIYIYIYIYSVCDKLRSIYGNSLTLTELTKQKNQRKKESKALHLVLSSRSSLQPRVASIHELYCLTLYCLLALILWVIFYSSYRYTLELFIYVMLLFVTVMITIREYCG